MMRRMGRRMRKVVGRNRGQAKARGREGEEVAKVGGEVRDKQTRRMQPPQKNPGEKILQRHVLRMTRKPLMVQSQHPSRKQVAKQKPKQKPKIPRAISQPRWKPRSKSLRRPPKGEEEETKPIKTFPHPPPRIAQRLLRWIMLMALLMAASDPWRGASWKMRWKV